MKTTTIRCAECGKFSEKPLGEIKRQLRKGRDTFFCSLSCSSTHYSRPKKLPKITVVCEYCGEDFETTSGCKRSRFCSRSCASYGSVTDYRRAKASETGSSPENIAMLTSHIGDGLRTREGWKYVDVKSFLDENGIKHIFEWQTGLIVFDLMIDEYKILVEFDGPNHSWPRQIKIDAKKDKIAKGLGYRVIRVECEQASVVPKEAIENVLLDEGWKTTT